MSSFDSIYLFKCKVCGYLATSRFPDEVETEESKPRCFECAKLDSYELVDLEAHPLQLYWVETADHSEDWFMVARSEDAARVYHEDYEGFARGDASAKAVAVIPTKVIARPGHPTHELVERCGGKFLRNETPRVVELEGRQFCEGTLEHTIQQLADDEFEKQGRGRPNRTKRIQKN